MAVAPGRQRKAEGKRSDETGGEGGEEAMARKRGSFIRPVRNLGRSAEEFHSRPCILADAAHYKHGGT